VFLKNKKLWHILSQVTNSKNNFGLIVFYGGAASTQDVFLREFKL